MQGLQAGSVDIALNLGPDDVTAVERAGGHMEVTPVPGVLVMSFLLHGRDADGPLQDVRVRRALNHAVNKDLIVAALIGGATRPATQFAPANAEGLAPDLAPYAYDPELARRLLAEAGYPDGFSFTLDASVSGKPNAAAVYQQVAADLARVGVDMSIRQIRIEQLIRGVLTGDFEGDAFVMDYGTAPSVSALRPMRLHSCLWRNPWFCDPEIMPTIEAARTAFDTDDRIRLSQQVMRFYHQQAPAILLYDDVAFDGVGGHVDGFRMVNNIIAYDEISLSR